MICSQCNTGNPADHKFCRECGEKLALDEAAEPATDTPAPSASVPSDETDGARRDAGVAALLTEALTLSERNAPEAALARAEEAVALAPTSTSAHALLAALYERTGQTDRAIRAMETVVSLNPDSSADLVKLRQLRHGVRTRPARAAPSRGGTLPPWAPAAAGAGAVVLVLIVGLALVNAAGAPRPASRSAASQPSRTIVTQDARPAASTGAVVSPPRPQLAKDPAVGRDDPFASARRAPANDPPTPVPSPAPPASLAQVPRPLSPRPTPRSPVASPATNAPRPAPAGRVGNGGLSPFAPTPAPAPAPAPSGDRVVVRPPATPAAPAPDPDTAAADAGRGGGAAGSYIRIQVGPPPGGNGGRVVVSAPPPTDPTAPAMTDPVQRAQALQAAGRYREAVAAYGEATASLDGMALGDAYQGLAQSHQRLGDPAGARDAYQRAIAAYQAQLAGRSAAAARRAIASCQAALEVLGNG